jgi:hypothetical protein
MGTDADAIIDFSGLVRLCFFLKVLSVLEWGETSRRDRETTVSHATAEGFRPRLSGAGRTCRNRQGPVSTGHGSTCRRLHKSHSTQRKGWAIIDFTSFNVLYCKVFNTFDVMYCRSRTVFGTC